MMASTSHAQQPTGTEPQQSTQSQESKDDPGVQTSAPVETSPRVQTDDGFAAKAQRFIKEKRVFERLSPERGWYPHFGGMPTGGGVAGGPGYRWRPATARTYADFADIWGSVSTRKYKVFDASARWLRTPGNRFELWSNFRYQDFPQEDFFGLGFGTEAVDRTSYTLESVDVAVRGLVNVTRALRVGADLGLLDPSIASGTETEVPSIEARFNDANAPGLAAQPAFFHHTFFVELDTRDEPGYPRAGSFYRASFGTWDDTSLQQYNFRRFDGEASHFFPLAEKAHTIALHGGVSYVNNADTDRVPFYMLPYLGGADTVRSFREYRFRDENLLFLNAEYRWDAFPYVQLAPFVDAGEVRHNWEEIGLHGLKMAYGVGVRVHTASRVFFRFDVATGGNEGTRVFTKFGPSF